MPEDLSSIVAADPAHVHFHRFVAIQNAKDLTAMGEFLQDSADIAWVTGGKTIFGRDQILEGLRRFYAGTWKIDPAKVSGLRTVIATDDLIQLHALATLHIGAPGESPRDVRYFLNTTYRAVNGEWKLVALIPIRVPE